MSPNKLIVPYLHRVCRHLLWPPYRARVWRELTDHILSRAEELRCRGSLTQEQAVRQVLRAPVTDVLGKALRQARLPLARVVYNVISATVWIAILPVRYI
ncbi:MAG: hypothetical protein ACLT4C_01085 [Butyricicoccus sp.]